MTCRRCGTEIADNALICYRCGEATVEPKYKPPAAQRRFSRRGSLSVLVVLVLVVSVALYVSRVVTSDAWQAAGWALAGLATVVLVARVLGRRRG